MTEAAGIKPPSPLRRIGTILTATGALVLCGVVFEFGISGLIARHSQDSLLPVFQEGVQTTQLSAPTITAPEGSPVALLTIPTLGFRELVVEGSSPNDLKSGPGHLAVSPMPGEFGNAVLLGRRTTYGAPMHDLNQLRPGDEISVTTGQGTFTYIVSEVGRVDAGDVSPLQGTLDSRLTLVTSDPPFLLNGRLVVVAMLQGTPLDVAQRTTPAVSASDLGMAVDPFWLFPAALSLQLLIAALWLVGHTRRFWPVSVTYMFAGPTIAALTVATVMLLDRGLPGTL